MAGRGSRRSLEAELQSINSRLQSLMTRGVGRGANAGASRSRRGGRGRSRSRSRSRGRNAVVNPPTPAAQTRASLEDNMSGAHQAGKELLRTVVLKANTDSLVLTIDFEPQAGESGGSTGPGMLRHRKLGKLFTHWAFDSLSLDWVPRVALNTPGIVHMGFLPTEPYVKSSKPNPSFDQIAACQPSQVVSVYQQGKITCPKSYLSTLRWYANEDASTDAAQFYNQINPVSFLFGLNSSKVTSDTTVGEIWINYSARYRGFDPT
ncbi:MAG: coat protein [Hangzhou tombus-like virus 1]|nr:MAG: coat protein [Hangzhou tombus-like virus 1]